MLAATSGARVASQLAAAMDSITLNADQFFVHARMTGLSPGTAFADEGIPGPSLDRDPSLLPESDWGMWNNGSYDATDPDRSAVTGVVSSRIAGA